MGKINNSVNSTTVKGTAKKDTITNYGIDVIINALGGNDVINNLASNVTIDGGKGNDKISTQQECSNVSIFGGEGNDSITVSPTTTIVTINSGSGNDTVSLLNSDTTVVEAGEGSTLVKLYSNITVDAEVQNGGSISFESYNSANVVTTITGSEGIYTLGGSTGIDNFKINGGYAVINNYDLADTINLTGAITESLTSNNDVILKTSDSIVRVKNMVGHNITVKEGNNPAVTKVYGNSYIVTPQDVIKKFMAALDSTEKTGTEALDEAVQAATSDTTLTTSALITQIVADAKNSNFLTDYCGINLDNDDTGAITGWDAGDSSVKTASSIVNENTAYITTLAGGSDTFLGLSIQYPNEGANGGQISGEELQIINGLHSWWLNLGLQLNALSYGNNFTFDKTLGASPTCQSINVKFVNSKSDFLAQVAWIQNADGICDSLELDINMRYYSSIESVEKNPDGISPTQGAGYLDRTLAHELTHAVMAANIKNFASMPRFIREGVAELTHGIDDERYSTIKELVKTPKKLKNALNLKDFSGSSVNAYAAGYIFLRYLAKQYSTLNTNINDTVGTGMTYNFDSTQITLTDEANSTITSESISKITNVIDASKRKMAINITGNDLPDSIKGGKGGDVLDGGKSSDDTLIGGAGKDTFNYSGGNDVITDYQVGKDTIQLGSGIKFVSSSVDFNNNNVIIGTLDTVTSKSGSLTVLNSATINKNGVVTGKKLTVADTAGNVINRVFGVAVMNIADGDGASVNLNSELTADIAEANASKRTAKDPIYILGNELNNILVGGKGADTLNGGVGNDSLVGGKGYNLFIYSDGNDTIGDYTVGKVNSDLIQLNTTLAASNEYSVSGSDIIIPLVDTDTVIAGTITVVNGKDKYITFVDTAGNTISTLSHNYNDPTEKIFYNTDEDNEITSYSQSFDVMANRVLTIDATRRTAKNPIQITGHAEKNNTIKGGKGGDTLDGGGISDDVLIGGKGADVFIYSGGDDVINDYTSGQDTISIASGFELINASVNSDVETDVIFTIANGTNSTGTLTVKNAVKKAKSSYTPQKLTFSINDITTSQVYSQKSLTVANADGDTINLSTTVNSDVTIVDASKRNKSPITIVGNSISNSINGGAGDDIINGGSDGINTLTGGKGNDIFVYNGGYSVITDFSNAKNNTDSIQIADDAFDTYMIDNKDIILQKTSTDTTVTPIMRIVNGKDKYITVLNLNGNDTSKSKIYSDPKVKTFYNIDEDNGVTNFNAANTIFETIDASARTAKNPIAITGNSTINNYIIGSKGVDELDGGGGAGSPDINLQRSNDTLKGGNGADTFIYRSGHDVIVDYNPKQDVIEIIHSNYDTYHVDNSDVVFTFGDNDTLDSLRVVNGKNKKITTIINGASTSTSVYADYQETILGAKAPDIVDGNESTDLTVMVSFNASSRKAKAPIKIIGNDNNNVLIGGAGEDILDGSMIFSVSGANTLSAQTNDTLTGGKGSDIFIYRGGADVITDYTSADKIQIAGVGYTSYAIKDTDVIFTFKDDSDTTLTVLNAQGKVMNFESIENGVAPKNGIYTELLSKILTKNDKETEYIIDTDVRLIDASKKTTPINVTANDLDSTIKGGTKADSLTGSTGDDSIIGNAGNDTLDGGNGNNTLTGGKGKDVFFYRGLGNNIITDYIAGEDSIQLGTGVNLVSVDFAENSDTDLKFEFNTAGSLTVKNAIKVKNGTYTPQKITFIDSNGAATSHVYAQKTLILANGDGDTIDASLTVNSSVRTIDASGRGKKCIYIIGNDSKNTIIGGAKDDIINVGEGGATVDAGKGNDYISGGSGNDSINAGVGNDTVYAKGGDDIILGGKGDDYVDCGSGNNTVTGGAGNDTFSSGSGSDTFVYSAGDGNDVIVEYKKGDKILLNNQKTTVNLASVSGSDYVFTIGKGSIIVKDLASDTAVTIVDFSGKETIYTDTLKTAASYTERSDFTTDIWFMNDDEIVNGEDELNDLTNIKSAELLIDLETTKNSNEVLNNSAFQITHYALEGDK